MESRIDLAADINDEDDGGLGWSMLSEARDPGRIRPGVMLVAGNRQAQAVVQVVGVDDDGQVHFTRAVTASHGPGHSSGGVATKFGADRRSSLRRSGYQPLAAPGAQYQGYEPG